MSARTDVVLVGGGHSHVQVLRRFAMERHSDIRLTVVLDTPVAVYSGMVPGLIAGQYRAEELEIDVVPLARRAGARVILSAAVGNRVRPKTSSKRQSPPFSMACRKRRDAGVSSSFGVSGEPSRRVTSPAATSGCPSSP